MKINIILIFILFSLGGYAKEYKFYYFIYNQYGKVNKTKEIKVVDNTIFVDGVKISNTNSLLNAKYLKKINISKEIKTNSNCAGGFYILQKVISNLELKETGCLDTKRNKEISESFDQISKDLILK